MLLELMEPGRRSLQRQLNSEVMLVVELVDLKRHHQVSSWKCFKSVGSFLDKVSTVSQVCDVGSSDAVWVRVGSLDAHLDSSSKLFDCWKAGI